MKNYISLIVVTFLLIGFKPINRIEALISKEIKGVFEVKSYQKEAIQVSETLNENLPIQVNGINFFKVSDADKLLGYYYYGQAFGKADHFDFLLVMDADLLVSKVKVLVYREDHGGEIASKRWLKQFLGTPIGKELVYEKDIIGISGATISVRSMTLEVNKALKTFDLLAKSNQL